MSLGNQADPPFSTRPRIQAVGKAPADDTAAQPVTPANHETNAGVLAYETSGAAKKTLVQDYQYWSGRITDTSFQLSLALLGANWAVFGTVSGILQNPWARLSILSVVLCLGINLVGARFMSELHRRRFDYAERDSARWQQEFEQTKDHLNPWPFTRRIEMLGRALREAKTWLPVLGAGLFALGLLAN